MNYITVKKATTPADCSLTNQTIYVVLLLPRFPKLSSQCSSNTPSNFGTPSSNNKIQPHIYDFFMLYFENDDNVHT